MLLTTVVLLLLLFIVFLLLLLDEFDVDEDERVAFTAVKSRLRLRDEQQPG